ncbi:hypothetical protein KAU86_02390 [bacterium]|nr:hypothetical protein [bacterium]MCK4436777.1 hypothetical protein [bacterium]
MISKTHNTSVLNRNILSFVVLAIFVFLAVGSVDTDKDTQKIKKQSPALAKVDKSADMQEQRKQLIEKLITQGIFAKVEVPGSLPRLWVKPAFYTLDFETKEKFVSVVYAYYFDGSNYGDTVRIFDNMSGKEVGSYSLADPGLRLK